MARKTYKLTLGTGKNKRTWELTQAEFDLFEGIFEEEELINISNFDPSKFKLTEVTPPNFGK